MQDLSDDNLVECLRNPVERYHQHRDRKGERSVDKDFDARHIFAFAVTMRARQVEIVHGS